MDADGTVLEEFFYGNRSDEVLKTAKRCKAKYGQCPGSLRVHQQPLDTDGRRV